MAVRFHPSKGQVLICDFSGMKFPEMQKRRPVVVISPRHRNQPSGLCTVVALSSSPPAVKADFHEKLILDLPNKYANDFHWVKGDMVYRVSFERLYAFHEGKDNCGKRIYFDIHLNDKDLRTTIDCVLYGIGEK